MKTVTVPLIRTDADLDLALARLREIWHSEDGTPEAGEILARKRSLTVEMIRKLHKGLGIPVESLVGA